VDSVDDLRRLRVATVAASSGEDFLRSERVRFATSPRSLQALQALQSGKVEAVVADVPIMRYLAANELGGEVEVGRTIFRAEAYGLGLRQGSPLREAINQRLLQRVGAPAWRDVLYRYMGADF
jgi:ABC-type amino acid transport substrate-binding protein